MKIVKASAKLMKHDVPPYKFIEKVGRTCYKSEDHITDTSAIKFIESLVRREHWAMLEHETIYLEVSDTFMTDFMSDMDGENERLKYFNLTVEEGNNVISGSFRSFHDLFERGYNCRTLNFIREVVCCVFPTVFGKFISDDIECEAFYGEVTFLGRSEFINRFEERPDILFHHLTHTFLFVCDRGVSHEFVRHRPASYAQESTRYCCYVKEKFGSEISVIDPCFWEDDFNMFTEWKSAMKIAESHYFSLIEMGATPQEARTVLPNSLKTELIVTATEEEWQHIVNLRYLGTTGAPHPQIKEVMGFAIPDLVIETKGRVNLDGGAK